MIQASEVRKGNLITGGDGVWLRVDEILKDGRFFCYADNGKELLQIEIINPQPIRLTPEILEKCGFKQDQFISRDFLKNDDYKFKAVNHYENGFLIICNFMQAGIKCSYLHQLQNLYFALTSKELEINL